MSVHSLNEQCLLTSIDDKGVVRLILNRIQARNALDDELIKRLNIAIKDIANDSSIRLVVLEANGKNFCAGADLRWMQRAADSSFSENYQDAMQLANLLYALNFLNKPTIAKIQGAVYGGGIGLVACCDIAIAGGNAEFALSEVRVGLIPATIAPYVLNAIGQRMARRYFLTGEAFNATEAHRIGLIHQLVDDTALDEKVDATIAQVLHGAPGAITAAKDYIHANTHRHIDEQTTAESAARIASIRVGEEAREGISAFLEKRDASWVTK